MKQFHFCYVAGATGCTGVNIQADSLVQANEQFTKQFPNAELLYVSEQNNLHKNLNRWNRSI